jgi:hypothetical protein
MTSMAHRLLSARRAGLGALLTASVLVLPDAASAHGIGGASDLPIPGWLFAWGATAVLILSFVALGVLWPKPRLESMGRRPALTLPRFAEPTAAIAGLALTALVVVSALLGTTDTATNLAPTFVWVAFWVAVPLATVVFGDFYTALDPWRTIARLAGLGSRAARPYPAKLGRWPAAAGLALIGWMELVWLRRDDPRALGVVILAYGAIQLAGMARYGIVAWRRNADPFAVYTHVLSHAAPVVAEGRRVSLRAPLSGLPSLAAASGTVAVMVVLIGTTSFDGLSRGTLWAKIGPQLGTFGGDLGLSTPIANQVTGTIGLLLALGLVAGVYRIGITGMQRLVRVGHQRDAMAEHFAHTLVPIAVAYVVAHYFSLVALQGQALVSLASDPLGDGANIFGTASVSVNYALLSAGTIWAVQVIALVSGHVGGLVLAHDRALTTFDDHRRAMRSQRFMLVVMVGFTSLGLWLLSGA